MEVDEVTTPDGKFNMVSAIKKEIKQEYDPDVNAYPVKNEPFFIDVKQLKVETDCLDSKDETKLLSNEADLDPLHSIKGEHNISTKPGTNNVGGQKGKKRGRGNTESKIPCTICDKRFRNIKNMKKHVLCHTTESRFQCALCNRKFREKHNLAIHIKSHRGEKDIPCPFCDKLFIVKSALTSHLRTHSKEKPYVCHICGRSFSHSTNLKPHIATHNPGMLFQCDECGERLRDRRRLLKHRKTHHLECKKEGCDFCLKYRGSEGFPNIQQRSWKCSYCSEQFKYYPTYKTHVKSHNNDGFTCKICNKSYVKLVHLGIHMRNHTGEAPYQCDSCGKKFKRRDSLKYHLSTHEEERDLFQCDLCDQAFTHSSSLYRHRRTAHSISVDESLQSCRRCNKKMHEKVYIRHMLRHKVHIFKCEDCKKFIEGEEDFEVHKKFKCVERKSGTGNDVLKIKIEEKDETNTE